MQMPREYEIIKTQSLDGELHFILGDLEFESASSGKCDLNETQIKEIMKKEAQKPLLLTRR